MTTFVCAYLCVVSLEQWYLRNN